MDTSLFPLRRVRYRPLDHLLGRKLSVSSCDKIERDVLATLASDVPGNFRLVNSLENLQIMLAKYGFIDLDFLAPRHLLSVADRLDRRAIRELGFSPRPIKQKSPDRGCLETLMNSVKQETYLRMFLTSDFSRDAMTRLFDEQGRKRSGKSMDMEAATDAFTSAIFAIVEKMKKSFPVTFTIEDACLTNCDAIWLAKHFYL